MDTPEEKTISPFHNRPRLEYFIVGALFFAAWIWFIFHSGGPCCKDDVTYMHLAQFPEKHAYILNRYFHIYFMKLFLWIAGPMQGIKIFWSFLTASTGLMVYISARLLSKNVINGILAVLILAAQYAIFEYPGAPLTDPTLMMLTTLGVMIFILLPRVSCNRHLLLIIFGLIFFFAFKTKENGVALGVLFLGLFFNDVLSLQRLFKVDLENIPKLFKQIMNTLTKKEILLALIACGSIIMVLSYSADLIGLGSKGLGLKQLFITTLGIILLLGSIIVYFFRDTIYQKRDLISEKIFSFPLARFANNFGWVIIGIIIGQLLLIILDWIFLDDAFFSIRPASWITLLSFNFGSLYKRAGSNYFQDFVLSGAKFGPFLLYLMGIYGADNKRFQRTDKYIWLLPLVIILLLTSTSIKVQSPDPRYIFYMWPIVSILAVQQLRVERPRSLRINVRIAIICLVILLTVVFFAPNALKAVNEALVGFGWKKPGAFYNVIAYPIALMVLIALIYLVPKWTLITLTFPLFCLGVILYYPLIYTWRELNNGTYAYESALRYYPYSSFVDQLEYEPNMKLFISKDIENTYPWNGQSPFKYGMLGPGTNELFDLYFNVKSNKDQLMKGTVSEYYLNYKRYTYALLTVANWDSIPDSTKRQIEGTHIVKPDPDGIIILVISYTD